MAREPFDVEMTRIVSYDEVLAARIRRVLSARSDVVEKKMFGGLCFMVSGAMCCGLIKTDLIVRVGPTHQAEALAQPFTRPMDFTGRTSKGVIYVDAGGARTDAEVMKWVDRALAFLAEKAARGAPKKRTRARQGNPRTRNEA